jgi:hypothetical protein
MQRRTVIIYSIFVVTVIYGAYFHFLSGDVNETGISPDSPRIDIAGPPTTASAAVFPIQTSVERAEAEDDQETWLRDPFRNNRGYRAPSRPQPPMQTQKLQRPKLSAVSISEAGAMAVVDGRVIAVGEKIGPWRLIEVTEDAALFEGPENSIWVRLGGSK